MQRSGQQEDAEATLHAGLQEVPNSGEIFAMLGWLYSKWAPTVRAVDARDCFAKAEVFGQKNRDLYAHWADLEFHGGEFCQAVKLGERSVAGAGSRDSFTWRLLGRGLVDLARGAFLALSTEQSGEFAERARAAYERAHEFSASDSDLSRTFLARLGMARVLDDAAEVGEVMNEWTVALPNDPFRAGAKIK